MYWINIYFRQLQYDFEAQEQTSISITESHPKFLMRYYCTFDNHTLQYECT